ncbi:hypothetical protein MRX96_055670 [Rhipicephalus microplus]
MTGSVWKLVYTELLLLTLGLWIPVAIVPTGAHRAAEEVWPAPTPANTFLHRTPESASDPAVLPPGRSTGTNAHLIVFELAVYYCSTFMEMIPLSFMLGFYVTFTATRWWNQYMAIPWPDRLMNVVMMYVPGQDESSRMLRRTLMRYLNLSLILVLRSISKAVKRRFPTKDHLIEAGFMTKLEMELWQSIPSTEFNTFWVPCTWFINLLREARNECRITDAQGVKLIMEEFNDFRSKCGLLWSYDWISIPLVYTQVVTLATYSFFAAALFGRQYIRSPDPIIDSRHHFDFYVPVFTVIQYFLYMGLLKVAEQLINPFGDDDEDFELNWIIDRHFKVSYLGVDTLDGPALPASQGLLLPHDRLPAALHCRLGQLQEEDLPRIRRLHAHSSSSLWTLLNRRSSSSGSLHQQQRDAEAGLVQPSDSTLHVYFKGADGEVPAIRAAGRETEKKLVVFISRRKHLLHPPEERRRGRLGSEPSPASSQKSFLRDLFHAKPALRVQAWTGAGGDYYGSPPKRPRKPRTKVSFSADTSSKPRIQKKHRSRSTSDLVAILETARKEALLSSLASMKAAMPRRKSLESSQTDVKLTDVLRRNKSLPEMNISDAAYEALLTPTPPPAPTKPVRTRTSLTSQILPLQLAPRPPALTLRKMTAPQKPPETPKPAPPTYTAPQPKPTPAVLLSPPPRTGATFKAKAPEKPQTPEKPPSRPETQTETASPVEITLRKPRVHLPRLVVPGPRRGIRLSDLAKEDVGSDGPSKSEPSATSSEPSGKPSTSIGTHTKPRLRVRVVPEPEIIPLEPTEPQQESADPEMLPPGPAPEPLPEPAPSLSSDPPDKPEPAPQGKDQVSEQSPGEPVADDDKTEFVVVIQEKSDKRPKQLIILPGPPDRAGSVDSLLGDTRPKDPKRRSSLDSPGTSASSPHGPEGSQESLAAAAPVHRRVPCEVLMRWQNVAPSESTEELDRPPPPPLLELPGAVLPPPRGHVRQLSRVFSHRSSSTTTSSVTVRASTTSHSRAASKAEAFLESEKRES